MNWISTKEKKPEYGKRVLAYSKGEDVEILKLEKDNEYGGEIWLSDLNYYKKLKTVDFWMELPKPPNNNQVKIEVFLKNKQYNPEKRKWFCTINGVLKSFDSPFVFRYCESLNEAVNSFEEDEIEVAYFSLNKEDSQPSKVKVEVWLRKEQYDNESKKWECTINGELKKFDSQNVVWDNFGTIEDSLASFKENEVVAVRINNGKIYKFLPNK